jgi:hypothetical protein
MVASHIIWSMVASQIFWSMVATQIFLEHGQFSNSVGTWVFLADNRAQKSSHCRVGENSRK